MTKPYIIPINCKCKHPQHTILLEVDYNKQVTFLVAVEPLPTIRQRIKAAWRILTAKRALVDEYVLDAEDCTLLANELSDMHDKQWATSAVITEDLFKKAYIKED